MKDKLISKAVSLGYSHYTECTVEELDIMSSQSYAKVIEMTFLQKWLREEYNIVVLVDFNSGTYTQDNFTFFVYRNNIVVKHFGIPKNGVNKSFDSYEKALEVGLKKGLKLIKK